MVELNKKEENFLKALLKIENNPLVYDFDPQSFVDENNLKVLSEEYINNFNAYLNRFYEIGFVNYDEGMDKFTDIMGKYYFRITPIANSYFDDKKANKQQIRKKKIMDMVFEFLMVVLGAFLGALLSKYI